MWQDAALNKDRDRAIKPKLGRFLIFRSLEWDGGDSRGLMTSKDLNWPIIKEPTPSKDPPYWLKAQKEQWIVWFLYCGEKHIIKSIQYKRLIFLQPMLCQNIRGLIYGNLSNSFGLSPLSVGRKSSNTLSLLLIQSLISTRLVLPPNRSLQKEPSCLTSTIQGTLTPCLLQCDQKQLSQTISLWGA